MRIGVISDTHGSKASMQRAVLAAGPVDMWLHAGDYSHDASYLKQLTDLPITAVAGNCDGITEAKTDEFISVDGKTIWLTHGHRHRAKERSAELIWWGRQYDADIIVYGHSHVADITWEGNLLLFNPGSPVHPRGGEASCGLLFINEGLVTASLVLL